MLPKKFMDAILNADVEQVRELINSEELIEDISWSENEHKFLSQAIAFGHYEIAKILLEKIFKVNNKTEQSITVPLHYAARSNNLEIVLLLLLRGANVNVKDEEDTTPLHIAVYLDNEKMVELFLGYGADPHALDNEFNLTPFQYACVKSNQSIVQSFLNHGCKINEFFDVPDTWECPKGSTPLHLSVLHKNIEITKLFLNSNANVNDVNNEGETALHLACGESDEETVKLLINKNALINICAKDNTTPLYRAIKAKNEKIVKILLDSGAFIENEMIKNSNIYRPIHTCIAAGCIKIIELLLQYGMNCNMKTNCLSTEKEPSFLYMAVSQNQINIMELLLKHNANVNISSEDGRTPLHVAAENGNIKAVELLLEYKAIVNVKDMYGLTPFHLACQKKCLETVIFFLNIGINVNSEDNNGETPLYLACTVGDYKITELLIKENALINVKTENGYTPLHIAVKNGHEKIVEMLLKYGADASIQTLNKVTALESAVELQNLNIVKNLLFYNHNQNDISNRKSFEKALLQYEKCGTNSILKCFLFYNFTIRSEDVNKNEILFTVVKKGLKEIVENLLNYNIDIDMISENGDTLLHAATKNEHLEIIDLLINHKANMFIKNFKGEMPIHCAVKRSNEKITLNYIKYGIEIKNHPELLHILITNWKSNIISMIKLLMKNGIDINYRNNEGASALHLIIQSLEEEEHEFINQNLDPVVEIVNYLLKHGANVDAKTKDGSTILHMIASIPFYAYKFENLFNTILKYNPEIDPIDKDGNTPLHLSAAKGDSILINSLLNAGANINIRNNNGLTPLNCIQSEKNYYRTFLSISPSTSLNNLFFKLARYDEAISTFTEHIIKLKAANLYVFDEIDVVDYKLSKIYENLEKEINEIKEIKINKYVSLYDILRQNITTVARYTRNENVDEILNLTKYKNKFPNYSCLIYSQLKKAIKREPLLIKAKNSLNSLCKYNLNDSCTENIFLYLSYEDLQNIILANFDNF